MESIDGDTLVAGVPLSALGGMDSEKMLLAYCPFIADEGWLSPPLSLSATVAGAGAYASGAGAGADGVGASGAGGGGVAAGSGIEGEGEEEAVDGEASELVRLTLTLILPGFFGSGYMQGMFFLRHVVQAGLSLEHPL